MRCSDAGGAGFGAILLLVVAGSHYEVLDLRVFLGVYYFTDLECGLAGIVGGVMEGFKGFACLVDPGTR